MKSIKTKLMLYIGLLLIVICAGLGLVSYYISSHAMISNAEETLPQTAAQAAKAVESRIEGKIHSLEVITSMNEINDPDVPWNEKMPILDTEVKNMGYLIIGISDLNGNIHTTKEQYSQVNDREYFQKAVKGESNVSDPLLSKIDGTLIVNYAVPIKNNGKVIGVLIASEDGNSLSNLTKDISFGKSGKAFIINNKGTTIAHSDSSLVAKIENIIEKSQVQTDLKQLADLNKKMISGQAGAGLYIDKGQTKYLGYAPIKSLGWSLAITAPKEEVLSRLIMLKMYTVYTSILFLLISLFTIYIVSKSISKGITASSKHLALISNGDFTINIDDRLMKSKDEVGIISKSLINTQKSIREMLRSIMESSNSIDRHSESLATVSEEMSASADNVASAIQEVAKGTNSQAENLSEITEMLNTFSYALNNINKSISDVHNKSKNIGTMADNSNIDMMKLSDSVSKLSSSFKSFIEKVTELGSSINQVNEITILINGIADQTNLLALNAAIEAARAGEAGKGFSVVAEEIRGLAEQTKSSSLNIANLISNISNNTNELVENTSMEMGSQLNTEVSIINTSVESFKGIVSAVNSILPSIGEVMRSSEDIEKQKAEILEKVESISAISEEVSTSSEEISASVQQMSASTGQVAGSAQSLRNMMRDMIEKLNKFKI